jgi:nucleotide-binding universal stress UspA family protein
MRLEKSRPESYAVRRRIVNRNRNRSPRMMKQREGHLMRILLAIDHSKFSEAAIRTLIEQNAAAKTTIKVLHVVEPIDARYYPELTASLKSFEDINRKSMDAGHQLVEKVSARLQKAGFQKVESSVLLGHPRTTIVDTAAKQKAELIVLGSHGRKGVERLLLGSVSEYVVRHAPCSVQIVREPQSKRRSR